MIDASRRFAWQARCTAAWMVASGTTAMAQECKNRGQLDTLYCDDEQRSRRRYADRSEKWKDPSTLVFAYTPVEDPRSIRTCSSRSPTI